MASDLLSLLVRANLALAAALLLALILRRPVRSLFGARAAYALWLVAPLAVLAVLLPARTVQAPASPPPTVQVPAETPMAEAPSPAVAASPAPARPPAPHFPLNNALLAAHAAGRESDRQQP